MNFETIFFFFFSSIALTSAIFVIYSTNTIYSAFFLILVFVNSTGLLLISEIEFISIYVLIYKKYNNNLFYFLIIFLIIFVFFLETFVMFSKIFTTYYHLIEQSFFKNDLFYNQVIYQLDNITNIETIGQILYSYYAFFFLAAGIILLIALIGAVTLTKKEKKKKNFLTKNLYKKLSKNSIQYVFIIKNKN